MEAEVIRCQCDGLEIETKDWALQDLNSYRQGKSANTTLELVRILKDLGIDGQTLLDIGGGIGVVQLELLRAGASTATNIEASAAYVEVAKEVAAQAGLDHRITWIHGNFVSLAYQVSSADVVTLDRVVCCYDDVEALVSLSAAKARKLYALVYPRDAWWVKLALYFENLGYRFRRSQFRAFVHPTALVDSLVRAAGLEQINHKHTLSWQIAVYRRRTP
jgi:magnesium-protoporphyrin O-methyltransferase